MWYVVGTWYIDLYTLLVTEAKGQNSKKRKSQKEVPQKIYYKLFVFGGVKLMLYIIFKKKCNKFFETGSTQKIYYIFFWKLKKTLVLTCPFFFTFSNTHIVGYEFTMDDNETPFEEDFGRGCRTLWQIDTSGLDHIISWRKSFYNRYFFFVWLCNIYRFEHMSLIHWFVL